MQKISLVIAVLYLKALRNQRLGMCMDNFEYLTVSYVLITGIGMSRLFISLGTIVEERAVLEGEDKPKFHWMLTTWILLTIAVISLSWHAFYKWNLAYESPTVELSPLTSLALTVLAGCFYILMELLSPEASEDGKLDMERHFLLIRPHLALWITAAMTSMILVFLTFSHDVTGSFTQIYRTSTAAQLGLVTNIVWILIVTPLYLPAHAVRDLAVVLTGFGMVVGMTLGTPTYSMMENDPDLDGVHNDLDLCDDSDTWFWEDVDQFGCTYSQLDTNADGNIDDDGDGIYDRFDKCPNTAEGDSVDQDGCQL
jgi:hypothetical protein